MHACAQPLRPQTLKLSDAEMPLCALHALTGLQQLERLDLDLTDCLRLTTDDLTATLALLFRGIPSLRSAEVTTNSDEMDSGVCVQGVQEQLARWGINPAPMIWVSDNNDMERYDSDMDSDDDQGAWPAHVPAFDGQVRGGRHAWGGMCTAGSGRGSGTGATGGLWVLRVMEAKEALHRGRSGNLLWWCLLPHDLWYGRTGGLLCLRWPEHRRARVKRCKPR